MSKRRASPTVDLAAVRASRRRLAELATEHPELIGAAGPRNRTGWESTLREDAMADETNTRQVAIRLPEKLLERLNRHVERMRRQTPGAAFTRADAVRVLLTQGLDQAEREGKGKAR